MSIYTDILRVKPNGWRRVLLDRVADASKRDQWLYKRHDHQVPPSDPFWNIWVLSGGRGSGKTRAGAEYVVQFAEENPNSRILIIGRTNADIRQVLVEGESGILSCYTDEDPNRPEWKPSIRRLVWPNGSHAFFASADEEAAKPDEQGMHALRGIQAHLTWGDEIGSWRQPIKDRPLDLDLLDNMRLATRLGEQPRIILTTTPRKKSKYLKKINKLLKEDPTVTRLTQASVLQNVGALSAYYVEQIMKMYEGTKVAKTELHGKWPWKR
ncbi:terminase large subunit [Microbacterium phage Zooman]|nr:terminase large subunit [Microbacterium phage Zooman]